MSIGIRKQENETWLQAAMRYAKPHGLEIEVKEQYDSEIASGEPEDRAAWNACYEWDVCELFEEMSEHLFTNPEGRGKQKINITITMAELYELVREKLDYLPVDYDPDAFCQDLCCLVEKKMGIYPNIAALKRKK